MSITAEIDRIHKGEGIVEIDGREVNIGPISRSDIGRTVELVSNSGTLQYCIRPAWIYNVNKSGYGLIKTQSDQFNIGPVDPDYVKELVDIVPYNNKAYCLTEDATDAAYPYHQYSRISDPIQTDWFPISTKEHEIELEISDIDGDVAHAKFGDFTSLDVVIYLEDADVTPSERDLVTVMPRLDKFSHFPEKIEADLIEVRSKSSMGFTDSSNEQDSPDTADYENSYTEKNSDDSQEDSDSLNLEESAEREVTTKEEQSGTSRQGIEKLRERAKTEESKSVSESSRTRTTTEYARSEAVREYVKARADGVCEGCGQPAPFVGKNDEPYLHVHHIYELSNDGEDTVDTVAALCPNCHYRVHHGKDGDEFNEKLLEIIQSKEAN